MKNYPIGTSIQLKQVLKALRKSKGLTQTQVGMLLNVNQRRASKIENDPGRTSFDQLSQLVGALGGRLVIELKDDDDQTTTPPMKNPLPAYKNPSAKQKTRGDGLLVSDGKADWDYAAVIKKNLRANW